MTVQVAGPSNRFLVPVRDRRWPRVMTTVLLAASLVLLALLLVGWPRLKSTSVHYQVNRLRAEVRQLGEQERTLALELERERNPARLAERASLLGLEPPPSSHVVGGIEP